MSLWITTFTRSHPVWHFEFSAPRRDSCCCHWVNAVRNVKDVSTHVCIVCNRLPSGMTYEPPTAWNWSGPTDNACSYYPPQSDPFGFYSTPQARLPFFPDMGISPYSSATNEVDFNSANGRLTFLGSQSVNRCGNGVMGVRDEPQLDNSNDRFVMMCCSLSIIF